MDLNCKGLLQNFCQKIKAELPRYNCAQRVQDKHPLFLATVLAMGRNFASEGEFSNKKQAEKSAAYVALRELGILPEEKTKDFEPSAAEGQGSGTQGTSQDGKNSNNTTSKEEHPLLSSSPNGTIVLSPSNSQQPSASSCGSNVSFKNVLQERAQKMGLALPHYETESLGSGFVCTVTFNGQCYKSEGFSPNKKHAQQSAACVALNLFSTERSECIESPGGTRNTSVVFENPCAVVKAAGVSYKNLLQEHCQQRGYKPPAYTTVWKGSGFSCTVHFGTQTSSFMGLCISNKKQAEQMAAREALLAIGITNPEEYLKNRPTRKNKSRRNLPKRFAPTGGLSRTSWVHPHAARDYDYYDYSWGDVDYYWEQSISRKRAHFDLDDPAPEKTSKLEVETFDLPMEHRRDLTVAELWKEKKSIAIVGHSESSFILYCTRVPGTCNLFNTRTMSLVSLEPGCRIIGLDARYVDLHGKVALQAERCADIIIPQIPDPVLTSCGVVLLYQDPQQNSIQVLLKRYLSSQAFVNVAAALAQYFRHQISGRVACLDITCLTEHIRDWMQQEVKNIATMNAAALRKVFAYMWKFNERWCAILEPPLPLDLQKLKATALDELSRRQASDVQHSEDFYHPWSLPKGNFKHRMLSTGLFIEPPIDCAVRELKEETGIKLDASELKNCPWIDLPQPDNFYNPHKGDMVRYFLYVYRPNTTDEDIKPLHQAENENSFDEEAAFFPKFPSLDSSTEEEAVEQETLGTCNNPYAEIDTQNTSEPETNVEDDSREVDAEKNKNPATLLHDAQSSEENNNNPAMLSRSGSTIVKRFIRQCVSGGTDMDLEQRGIKRKRDDDNDDDDDNIPFETSVEKQKQLEKPTTSTFHEQCQSAIETPTNSQEVITAKSPHVQGGVHEECSWFLVDEARIKSPAFKQVYQTWQFQDILLSVSKGET